MIIVIIMMNKQTTKQTMDINKYKESQEQKIRGENRILPLGQGPN